MNSSNDSTIQEEKKESRVFCLFVFATLIAYISRVGELLPILGKLRINLILFSLTFFLFFATGQLKKIQWQKNKNARLITYFALLASGSIIFSIWPSHSWDVFVNSMLLNFTIFLLTASIINTPQSLSRSNQIIVISCILLLGGLHFKPVVVEGFRYSTTNTYDSNDLALIFSFSLPLLFTSFTFTNWKGKILHLPIILAIIISILKTGSRGGMLSFGFSFLLLLFSSNIKIKSFHKLIVIATAITLLFSSAGDGIRDRFAQVLSGEDYNLTTADSDSGGRLAIWKSGVSLILQHPAAGVGLGNSQVAMGESFGDKSWMEMHNSFLQATLELGLAGGLLYILILLQIYKNCKEAKKLLQNEKKEHAELINAYATSFQIALFAYTIAGFFLSQAYSVIIPLLLGFTSILPELAKKIASPPLQPHNAKKNK